MIVLSYRTGSATAPYCTVYISCRYSPGRLVLLYGSAMVVLVYIAGASTTVALDDYATVVLALV